MRFRMASSAADAARHRQRVIEWANPSPPYAALHESGSGTKRTYRDVRYLSVTAPGALGIWHLRPVSWIIPTKLGGAWLGGAAIVSCYSLTRRSDVRFQGAGSTGHCNTARSLSAGVSNPKVFRGR